MTTLEELQNHVNRTMQNAMDGKTQPTPTNCPYCGYKLDYGTTLCSNCKQFAT
ncbi:MAG: hypothetical protein FWB96_05000 [Defluviitaleaceae bacterium]|nr:hypothetical protein [Defluviitaleaceae bacterium]MCL2262209.1 hypothetical protein [Defluviitaleaceae bacterium]